MYGMLAAAVLIAAAGDAYAATLNVDCSSNPGALAAQFASGGTAGTTFAITGGCYGGFYITQDNITIEASAYGATITGDPAVGIRGASNIILQDLAMLGPGSYEAGHAVHIVGPASVTIQNYRWTSTIGNAVYGIIVEGPASVNITGTTIQNTGSAYGDDHGAGISASGPSRVSLGAGCCGGTSIQNNQGIGIDAFEGATIEVGIDCYVSSGPSLPAIQVRQSSSLLLAGIPPVDSAYVVGTAGNHTIVASQGSRVTLSGATVIADTPFDASNQFAVIAATDSSSVILAGFNFITNSAPGGAAVMVTGGSSFKVSNHRAFLVDTINGRGLVHTQSVMELGASANGGGINWTGDILVNQASSFRADGDNVTINGTLTLDQAANGYFNHQAGTTNDITKVVCNSTTDHVSNPTLVTPNITIGPPPGCALF